MAQTVGRLSALKVSRIVEPGLYPDGARLYLQVRGANSRSWIYRYKFRGKMREMGLGSLKSVSLLEARKKAAECRRLRSEGVDPVDARKNARVQAVLEAAKSLTFKDAAAAYIEAHRPGWRSEKHAAQWKSSLATYAEPILGNVSVQAIETPLVLRVLQPIWPEKPETASRLRSRIAAVLDWAKVQGLRAGENPARWQGHLAKLLPAKSKVRAVEHHAALPFDQLFDFMTALRTQDGIAARALEFTVLTAARTGETIGATWSEIDLGRNVWTIAAKRMKAGKEHRVPLCGHTREILEQVKAAGNAADDFVFRGGRKDKPLSNMAMTEVLRRMGRSDLTVHGFRSTFRDWAAERTKYSPEVVEIALAHAVSNKVEAAYRRGDLFEKRRLLMVEWTRYSTRPQLIANAVIALRQQTNRSSSIDG